ncbi:hypothetical protein SPI_01127 [Niveomyces insectorum RCEF 264]|uniref:HNH nuclease domain-containing protein n=1 Tax=Niveomyces insectorum RCEF 264 TaxID=1081102 RepID=A0A167YPT4_9HYPO|nr:hypothetical protein SPI_01127 [Niveomyces insectorum RCEF 264]
MAALPPFTPPAETHSLGPTPRAVRFRHPAYPDSTPDLLVLMAADGDGGLDYDLALAACCIVAGVHWDGGYLAQKALGNHDLQRVDRPHDGLLRAREYFFCVDGQDPSFKYPVVPSFHHWRFPHGGFDGVGGTPRGSLPLPWRDLRFPDFTPPRPTLKGPAAAMDRDITCRVTGHMNAVEKAHLVPEGERLWYCRRPLEVSAINDDKNILVLRKDIHHLFNTRRFTFVPKRFSTSASEAAKLVTHVLLPSGSPELIGLYHNRLPQPIYGISVECLLARFAWSIFTDEHIPFFQSDSEYTVLLWNNIKGEAETRTLKGLDVGSITRIFESTRTQSRSVNPKKRSRSTYDSTQGDSCDDCSSDEDDITSDDDGDRDRLPRDYPPRGRSLKRVWDDDHVPSVSSSFTSATQSSIAGVPTRLASQPPTPKQAGTVASPGRRPQKRMHVQPRTVYSVPQSQ